MVYIRDMKILIEAPAPGEEDTIIIKYHTVPTDLIELLRAHKSNSGVLLGYKESSTYKVPTVDIFYIDSVDNKTFMYCLGQVYEAKEKLYEIEELAFADFLRVSKSIILNLRKIDYLKPALSGRFEATLTNGEKVLISRSYVKALKEAYGM